MTDIRAIRRYPNPAALRPWPFPAFEEAIMACLAAHPEDRPTAKELATSLP
ncbi:MAG: hypothetical protein ACRDRS_20450 [Pseudonocardiaceae bacterium]